MIGRGEAIYELLQHVRPIVLNSTRVVEDGIRDLGWTVGSRAVVEVLASEDPLTVPQIARRLSLARQNVQRHVDDLRRHGHVRAVPNPAHGRSVLIELTEDGAVAYRHTHARELRRLAGLAADLTDEQLAIAQDVLAALDEDIRRRAEQTKG